MQTTHAHTRSSARSSARCAYACAVTLLLTFFVNFLLVFLRRRSVCIEASLLLLLLLLLLLSPLLLSSGVDVVAAVAASRSSSALTQYKRRTCTLRMRTCTLTSLRGDLPHAIAYQRRRNRRRCLVAMFELRSRLPDTTSGLEKRIDLRIIG